MHWVYKNNKVRSEILNLNSRGGLSWLNWKFYLRVLLCRFLGRVLISVNSNLEQINNFCLKLPLLLNKLCSQTWPTRSQLSCVCSSVGVQEVSNPHVKVTSLFGMDLSFNVPFIFTKGRGSERAVWKHEVEGSTHLKTLHLIQCFLVLKSCFLWLLPS